jgi:hypothetical protein
VYQEEIQTSVPERIFRGFGVWWPIESPSGVHEPQAAN